MQTLNNNHINAIKTKINKASELFITKCWIRYLMFYTVDPLV